jgi:hypothetical protein
MLLRVYYLYHKSPKKCHDLEEVVQEMKMCFKEQESDVAESNLRGKRLVAHGLSVTK